MFHVVHYYQPCPVCGRSLRIRVSLLGKRVFCQHCGGGFRATDPASLRPDGEAVGPGVSTGGEDSAARSGPSPVSAIGGAVEDRPRHDLWGAGDDLLRRVEVVLQRAEQASGLPSARTIETGAIETGVIDETDG